MQNALESMHPVHSVAGERTQDHSVGRARSEAMS